MKNEESTKYENYIPKTDKEIKEIALGIYKGIIFTSNQIKDNSSIGMVFSAFLLSPPEYKKWLEENKISMLYEHLDKAGPRSINGYPMFISHGHLNNEDEIRVKEKFEEIKNLMELV